MHARTLARRASRRVPCFGAPCAPGYSKTEKTHHWWVSYCGKTFQNLDLGSRGSNRPDVYVAKVRSMARLFGILLCAKREIHGL